ncbi:MAG: DUF1598 domain-containing protein [Pirellula sp.]|nr:DUF1598 domain-containing protein [Pirellula sp.]
MRSLLLGLFCSVAVLKASLLSWPVALGVCVTQDSGELAGASRLTSSTISDSAMKSQLSEIDNHRAAFVGASREQSGKVGAGGGAPLANFGELMNIIETVVEGGWESQGGNSSMIPHTNGVRVNTAGVLERISPAEQDLRRLRKLGRPKADLSALGRWQEATPLRWISLKSLDLLVKDRIRGGMPSSVAMELLGGMYRLDYLAYDKETNDWLVGGPAGDLIQHEDGQLVNRETGLPPILLEDLLSIGPVILNGGKSFGCTINPDETRLKESFAFAQKESSLKSLRSSPDRWLETWKKTLGNQSTIVIGLPADSPTGLAMLIADAEMKRLGLGVDPLPKSIKSYWEELDHLKQAKTSTMLRWWLSLSDSPIVMDKERRVYSLEKDNVRLLTESQHFEATGKRVASLEDDPAANRFAESFTKNYKDLVGPYPVFGRLQHIMDLAVALEIVRLEIEYGRGDPFVALSLVEAQPRSKLASKEIETIAATHKAYDGSRMAVVSGGVGISVDGVRKQIKISPDQLNHVVLKSGGWDAASKSQNPDKEVFWR